MTSVSSDLDPNPTDRCSNFLDVEVYQPKRGFLTCLKTVEWEAGSLAMGRREPSVLGVYEGGLGPVADGLGHGTDSSPISVKMGNLFGVAGGSAGLSRPLVAS